MCICKHAGCHACTQLIYRDFYHVGCLEGIYRLISNHLSYVWLVPSTRLASQNFTAPPAVRVMSVAKLMKIISGSFSKQTSKSAKCVTILGEIESDKPTGQAKT